MHRTELIRQLLPDNGKVSQAVKPEAGKADLEQLIERADAAAVRREKVLLARARADLPREKAEALTAAMADPTRPQDLRSFDAADGAVLLPVSGPVMVPRDKPEDSKGFSQGLTVTNPPGAVVAALDLAPMFQVALAAIGQLAPAQA